MKICVFCSARDIDEKYTRPAEEFARMITAHGHALLWGGSDTGLMKLMASAVQNAGGKIYGVSMEVLREKARKNADEMIIAKDLGARKAALLERADVIVMLVGGVGTLDEATEIIELKKHRLHDKPIIILNTENFYEGFKTQLERMEAEGFLSQPLDEFVYFANTPDEASTYIEEYDKGRTAQ